MKKKILACMLCVVMMAVSLAGCSGKPEEQTNASEARTDGQEEQTDAREEQTNGPEEQSSEEKAAFKPEKSISFIVGFDAGGAADIPARVVAKYMAKYAGVDVIVSNIVGSSGRVAANQVKSMEPDNYTLLHVPVGYYMQAALGNADFTYEDFEPVTMWCDSWVGLVVRSDAPYETYEEFIEAAKANPGEIRIGSVSGTLPQLAALAISEKEGAEFNMVDIGLNNKATELLGNRIDAYIDGVGSVKQYVDSGDFKCLMAFAYEDTSIPGFEGLTSAESLGYTDFDYLLQSFGMWAPKGTDPEVVEYYAELIRQVSEDPECIAELNALGYGARSETPEAYAEICGKTMEGTVKAVAGILE